MECEEAHCITGGNPCRKQCADSRPRGVRVGIASELSARPTNFHG